MRLPNIRRAILILVCCVAVVLLGISSIQHPDGPMHASPYARQATETHQPQPSLLPAHQETPPTPARPNPLFDGTHLRELKKDLIDQAHKQEKEEKEEEKEKEKKETKNEPAADQPLEVEKNAIRHPDRANERSPNIVDEKEEEVNDKDANNMSDDTREELRLVETNDDVTNNDNNGAAADDINRQLLLSIAANKRKEPSVLRSLRASSMSSSASSFSSSSSSFSSPVDPKYVPAVPFPHPRSKQQPGDVLVAVITGGPKNTTVANRQAVVDTWADEDTYFVTHEKMDAKANILWLPDIAETGGSGFLSRKVLIMWYHIWRQYGDEYKWFIKADDDTFLNLPRIRSDLAVLNPDVPIFLGAKRYGASAKGTVGPGYMWEDKNYIMFCHGGAGYILSRGLLRHLAENIALCLAKKPHLSLEDARMTSCIYQHSGVDCLDFSATDFGALDFFRNRHDQSKHEAQIAEYTASRERLEILLTRSSFHSVTASTTYKLHSVLTGNPDLLRQTLNITQHAAANAAHQRRFSFTAAYNCSAKHGSAEAAETVASAAVCQASMLADSPPPSQSRFIHAHNTTWSKHTAASETPVRASIKRAPFIVPALKLAQDSSVARTIPPYTGPFRNDTTSVNPPSFHLQPFADALRTAALTAPARNLVLVHASSADADAATHVRLLVRSLRDVGSAADVAVFFDEGSDLASLTAAVRALPGVSLHRLHSTGHEMDGLDHPLRVAYAAFADFLLEYDGVYDMALTTRAQTLFQRDPFTTIETYSGVAFFVRHPMQFAYNNECHLPKVHQLLRVSTIDEHFIIGTAGMLRDALARLLFIRHAFAGTLSPSCTPSALITAAVWHKQIGAAVSNLIIYGPLDGPVLQIAHNRDERSGADGGDVLALLRRLEEGDSVVVVNSKNAAVSVVLDYAPVAAQLGRMRGEGAVLPVVLDEAVLAESGRSANAKATPASSTTLPMDRIQRAIVEMLARNRTRGNQRASEVWITDDKANERFRAIFTDYENDPEPFSVVQAMLERFSRFQHDPTLPVTVKIGSPKTHKTGSSTLSSILFRVGARNNARMFHRGTWAFLPPYTMVKGLNNKALRHTYDMEFHHLSPNGRWKGNFGNVLAWYQHLIGDDVTVLTLFREPKQQYVSWAYFYYIPNKYPTEPEVTFRAFLDEQRNPNPLAGEFGLFTEEEVDLFLAIYMDKFKLVLLSERFDECLVLMRRMLNWDLLDITYMKLLDSSKDSMKRWDGKKLVPTPKVASLPKSMVEQIANITMLDTKLYKAAERRLNELIAQQDDSFQEEVKAFRELQRVIEEVCKEHMRHAFCIWYQLEDLEFFGVISEAGYTPAVAFDGIKPPL